MSYINELFYYKVPKRCTMYQVSKLYFHFFKDSSDNLFLSEIKTIIKSNYEGVHI